MNSPKIKWLDILNGVYFGRKKILQQIMLVVDDLICEKS